MSKQWSNPPEMILNKEKTYQANIHTDKGVIEILRDQNPLTFDVEYEAKHRLEKAGSEHP